MLLGWWSCAAPEPVPAASVTTVPPVAASPAPPPWSVDGHVDTLTELGDRAVGFDDPGLQSGIPAMRVGGTTVVVNVLWPPRDGDHEAITMRSLERFQQQLPAVADQMVLVRTVAEADRALRGGKIATLLALEGAHGIERSGIEGLHRLHASGLAMLGLTWSLSNRFAGSSSDGGSGLTEDGRALVAEAQRIGILVDLAHASRQTVLDTCAVTTRPLVVSHAGARSVHDVPRNLSDAEIRCVAASDGWIGAMFHSPFVGAGKVGVAEVADQVDALVRTAGAAHVGIGSDWDGDIAVPTGLESARGLPTLWAELARRGYDAETLAGIRGENFRRVWSAAGP